jgi:hypothetical protein
MKAVLRPAGYVSGRAAHAHVQGGYVAHHCFVPAAHQGPAQYRFRIAATVTLGRVKKVHAGVQRRVDSRERLRFLLRAPRLVPFLGANPIVWS